PSKPLPVEPGLAAAASPPPRPVERQPTPSHREEPTPEPASSSPRLPRPLSWSRPASAAVSRASMAPAVEPGDEGGATGLGVWVSSVLFVLTLLTGLGLAAYAFVRPLIKL